MPNTNPADITLVPADDGTYAVLPRATSVSLARRDVVRARLTAAKLGWFLGFNPKSAADRAKVERRIAEYAGTDLTVAWS